MFLPILEIFELVRVSAPVPFQQVVLWVELIVFVALVGELGKAACDGPPIRIHGLEPRMRGEGPD